MEDEKKKNNPFAVMEGLIKKRKESAQASDSNMDKSMQHDPKDIEKSSGFKKY